MREVDADAADGYGMKAPRWLDRRIAAPGPYLTLCLSEDEFKSVIRRLRIQDPGPWISNDHSDATVHHIAARGGSRFCIVCVSGWEGRDPIELAGLLVHESVHIWQCYADDIGERNPGAEQEAYAIQSIAQELMTEFARRMKAMV